MNQSDYPKKSFKRENIVKSSRVLLLRERGINIYTYKSIMKNEKGWDHHTTCKQKRNSNM